MKARMEQQYLDEIRPALADKIRPEEYSFIAKTGKDRHQYGCRLGDSGQERS